MPTKTTMTIRTILGSIILVMGIIFAIMVVSRPTKSDASIPTNDVRTFEKVFGFVPAHLAQREQNLTNNDHSADPSVATKNVQSQPSDLEYGFVIDRLNLYKEMIDGQKTPSLSYTGDDIVGDKKILAKQRNATAFLVTRLGFHIQFDPETGLFKKT